MERITESEGKVVLSICSFHMELPNCRYVKVILVIIGDLGTTSEAFQSWLELLSPTLEF